MEAQGKQNDCTVLRKRNKKGIILIPSCWNASPKIDTLKPMNPCNFSRWICTCGTIGGLCPLCTLGTSLSSISALRLHSALLHKWFAHLFMVLHEEWFHSTWNDPMAVRAQDTVWGWWCGCCSVLCPGLLTGQQPHHYTAAAFPSRLCPRALGTSF